MSQKAASDEKHISKNKAAGIAAACLVIGFIGGVAYSTLTPGPGSGGAAPAAGPSAPTTAAVNPDLRGRIFALEQQVASDPKNLDAWLELGNLYFDTRNPQQAIRAYGKYLEANPSNPDVLTDMGIMYREIRQPAEAIKCFDRAMTVDPDHQQSRYNKGVVLLHDLQDLEAALKEWRILAEKNPEFKTQDGRSIKDLVQIR